MNVEVWADLVCPWCYIGTHNLDAALDLFAHRDSIHVIHRSFELDPSVPADDKRPVVEVLAEKYGVGLSQAMEMQARVTAVAAGAGLTMNIDRTMQVNSFDAHRVVQLAAKFSKQHDVVLRLYRAHFVEGGDIGDHAALVTYASEAGLDPDEVGEALTSGAYADDVRVAESTAKDLGVQGVPFFVIDRRYAVSGAQPPDVLVDALQQAWDSQTSDV